MIPCRLCKAPLPEGSHGRRQYHPDCAKAAAKAATIRWRAKEAVKVAAYQAERYKKYAQELNAHPNRRRA